ncbi:MAG: glycosyltransferase family 39 protein [Acidobacteriota bacterium]|jgi:4-amino-4-deoxy-L-arabinose transferase-like glycosyltransferase|nr:glycosyltransferase family 39 protein [Acidobacteriota bacterium]
MKRFLIFIVFCAIVFVLFFVFPKGAVATIFSSAIVIITLLIIDWMFEKQSAGFLKKVFLVALLLRVFVALMIYLMEWERTFGPDSITFDIAGRRIVGYWTGMMSLDTYGVEKALSFDQTGWGMNYFVGIIYYLSGRNQIAIQFISCTLGAATVPAVYFCAKKIFNTRAAKYSALAIALFPAMIIWSSQMLKDGFILFFLVVSMACIIELHEKIDYPAIFILLISLFGLLAFRSYICYMVTAAAIGSFIIVAGKTSESIIKRLVALLIIATAVGYLGFSGDTKESKDTYTLEDLQTYRQYQAEGTGSGFGEDYDISTVEGTVILLPIGIVYILFAPFPWQMLNARQILVAPEMLIWWMCIPLLIKGLWFTMKTRLRASIPILTFSAMLTTAYALFQSNIGAAYRQRTQIQVFLFIFIAVGWTLYKEKKENRDLTFKERR